MSLQLGEKENLPEQKIENPLTLVYLIDGDIAELEEKIATMKENRDRALAYAVKNGITEEGRCRLEKKAMLDEAEGVITTKEIVSYQVSQK